uniref:26S proteasome non-ATPase regulatory subunit 4 homolog n=1 Tax=Salix viminalis TaxID=40686 RepID=A0A6N2M1C7_SALVM
MGGSEEANKATSLHDSSSPSQPLLFKPPSIEEPDQPDQPESDPTQYLQISYNYGPRPFKDLPFVIFFVFVVLCTFGFGIFSVFHKNSNYSNLSSYKYDLNSNSCVKNSTLSGFHEPRFDFYSLSSPGSVFLKSLIWTLVVTLILSVPVCFLLLLSLKHYTKQIVYVSLPFFVVIPIFFNVYWFVACTVSSSCSDAFPLVYRILVLVFVFLIIGIIVWIFVANWHRVELTVKIIGVASDALSKNLGLFVVIPLLTLGLVVYYAPIVVFLVFARLNGKIVPKESKGEYKCVWKQDSWVPAYYTLAILTMLWSLTVMVEAQVYVISGTIAQWYFTKEDAKPRRSIRSSLRNAFGPSSGTVCLSGLLICFVRLVRAAVDSASQENVPGMVNLVLRCCVKALLSAVDFLNKFTINFVAITGEAYCTSARMTYELLKRNLLSAVFVETVSTRLLAGITFVLSAIYAIVVCAILKGASSIGVYAYVVAALAWALLIIVLGFFAHVLENVIETVYIGIEERFTEQRSMRFTVACPSVEIIGRLLLPLLLLYNNYPTYLVVLSFDLSNAALGLWAHPAFCLLKDRLQGSGKTTSLFKALSSNIKNEKRKGKRKATMICIDNSEWMRNGDYSPSRFQAQADAVNLLCGAKTQSNPENTVGILTMAGKQVRVLTTLTSDLGKILSCMHGLEVGGEMNLSAGIQVAQLALKHRQNKNQQQRIIVFAGSPIKYDKKMLETIGKKLKKNNVSLDIVDFGEEEDGKPEKLEALFAAVNSNDSSHIVHIPPGGTAISDALMNTPVFTGDGEGGSGFAAAAAAAAAGGGDFDFGVDPNLDPELGSCP